MTRARDLADGADKDITGTLTLDDIVLSNDMSVADNGKVQFGAGSDLQIYHDGSNSYVSDNGGTGSLRLGSDGTVQIAKATAFNELMAQFTADGGCELRHDNAAKLNTSSTGIDVTGTVTADGLIVQGNSGTSSSVVFGYNEDGGEINLHDETGAAATLLDQAVNNTRLLELQNGSDLILGLGATNTTGNILFNSAGYSTAMTIDSSGNVGIGGSETTVFNGVGGDMKFVVIGDDSTTTVANNSDAGIAIVNTNQTAGNLAGLHFARADTDDSPNYAGASIVAQFNDAQVTGQYPKGELAFLTSTTTNAAPSEKMRLTPDGRLGIGTTSPATRLSIGDSTVNSENVMTLGKRVTSAQSNLPVIGHTSHDGSASDLGICATSSSGNVIFYTGNDAAGFGTGSNAERMRIDASGRVTMPFQPYIVLQGNNANNKTWNQNDRIGATDDGTTAWSVANFANMTYNSNTGSITVSADGVYAVYLQAYYNGGSPATNVRVQIRKNGAVQALCHNQAIDFGTLHVSALVPMSSGNYIDFQHASGADRDFYEGGAHTYAFIQKVA